MIIITQENKVVCDECSLTIVLDKVEYPQGYIPLISHPPSDWTVITHGTLKRTFCPKHRISIKGSELVVDSNILLP